jgi:hypothetical protein
MRPLKLFVVFCIESLLKRCNELLYFYVLFSNNVGIFIVFLQNFVMTISNERIENRYSNVAKALVLFTGSKDNGLTVTVLCKATK